MREELLGKVFFLIGLTVIFMIGMLTIDNGASMKIMEVQGYKPLFETLVFRGTDGRIVYHAGVVVVIFCWLVLSLLFLIELTKKV